MQFVFTRLKEFAIDFLSATGLGNRNKDVSALLQPLVLPGCHWCRVSRDRHLCPMTAGEYYDNVFRRASN